MRKNKIDILVCIFLIFVCSVCGLWGCGKTETEVTQLDYTVVEDKDIPQELKNIIDEKKESTIRLTYNTDEYTYAVAGYGTMGTSGYSICVNSVSLGTDSIYVDIDLLGPKPQEQVAKVSTTPYIVLKMEKRDETVVFNM